MMSKFIAVEGDTQFETSTATLEADTDGLGSWSLVSSDVTKGQVLSVDGKMVEVEATASWSYTGGSAGGSPIGVIPDSATLTAGPTVLTDQGNGLLLDGDEQPGMADSGNKIVVSVSQTALKTD